MPPPGPPSPATSLAPQPDQRREVTSDPRAVVRLGDDVATASASFPAVDLDAVGLEDAGLILDDLAQRPEGDPSP